MTHDEHPPAPTSEPTAAPAPAEPTTPFGELTDYIRIARVGGLALSPDGSRLVTSVATLAADGTKYVSALWEIDPAGEKAPIRLTRSTKGERGPVFTAEGDLLFSSARPDPGSDKDDAPAALWLLPAAGGEARVIASRTAGIDGVHAAADAPVVVVTSAVLPGASTADGTDDERDTALLDLRKEKKVGAILHSTYPVRYWDHDLGPSSPHLFVGALPAAVEADGAAAAVAAVPDEPRVTLRDVTPGAGPALVEQSSAISPDGATIVTGWTRLLPKGDQRQQLVAVDAATGQRRVLLSADDADYGAPVISPDGRWVAYLRDTISDPHTAPDTALGVVALDGSGDRLLTADWDRWCHGAVWLPDSSGLLVVADDDGRSPVFHVKLDGTVARVTSDDLAYTNLQVSKDGAWLYALASSYLAPSSPVRVDLAAALAGEPVASQPLRSPVPTPALPGTLTEVETTAADGVRVRAWLALPAGASAQNPAPLLLWIHGGPLGSWNAWSWRWNPWLMVAKGYAVVLPDPALSTGYGLDFIQRGWGKWGSEPFTDLMAVTDAVVARDDIDADRTAAMGGSFGGYMANWVAGHTDRFKAIVTHASLWALDQFGPTTDAAFYWEREMTGAMAMANSPHLTVGQIRTPMLVIHGDRDYRVPIGEGLRLWYELLSQSSLPAGADGVSPHRFLYFPDENHWVLAPQHAIVWYETVLAFLSGHVLDAPTPMPEILG